MADRQALLAEQREVMRQSSAAAAADFGDDADEDAAPQAEHAVVERLSGDAPAEAGEPQPLTGEILPPDHTDDAAPQAMENAGGEDEAEAEAEPERRRPKSLRNYKIQEVIKRRQIVLVQVVKEERGNKGAALTTYLSLAGRYCVLMPNTARGGGVSRKITNAVDRKRLKAIANEMEIPEGMAVIVRTAGSERTKPEIRRDYEYLLRLWDSVRDLTLRSSAPALVYEEANLIKRSIRDLYSRDIDDILVDGEEGYRLAKDFMRMLTPSHAKKVQLYKDPAMPLFQRFQIENQLDAMHSAVVQLKSGGYLVINQTEALVAIDVNSGRSTKERHIEETALKTNLEASDEVARQLRLRDLAGLIVIDFIDMEETRNNHAVERRLKDAMRFDRARIQLGKISPFGLMELSRQRLRPSLMETSFQPCPHCGGTGMVRSVESSSVHVLRAIEEEGIRRRYSEITVTVNSAIALYVLNQKRAALTDIEARYGFRVSLLGDDSLIPPAFRMDKVKSETPIEAPAPRPISSDLPIVADPEDEELPDEEAEEAEAVETETEAEARPEAQKDEDGEGRKGRRRRRSRRRRRDEGTDAEAALEDEAEAEGEEAAQNETAGAAEAAEDDHDDGDDGDDGDDEDEAGTLADGQPAARRRRRGKRGGRRRNRGRDAAALPPIGEDLLEGEGAAAEAGAPLREEGAAQPVSPAETTAVADEAPKPKRSRARKKPEPAAEAEAVPSAEPAADPVPVADAAPAAEEPAPAQPDTPETPSRKGWWNRFL